MNSSESELRAQAENLRFTNLPLALNTLWPAGKLVSTDVLPSEIDATQLHMVIDGSFAESDPRRPRRTRAVVIVYKGRIVAERYGVGFSADTPLLGYSMTKTVTNALTGILVRDGKLFVEDSQLFAEWRKSAGLRGNISLDQLLRMTDGLRFRENYENNIATDLNRMLLGTGDVASYAINKPLEAKPGTRWRYSSGTTNIISRLVRDTLEQEPESVYLEFPRKALFEPIGMSSAVLETDAVGTFVGSTSMQACRDAQDAKRDIQVAVSPSLVTTAYYAPAALRPCRFATPSHARCRLRRTPANGLTACRMRLHMPFAGLGPVGPNPLRPYARADAFRGLRALASLSMARSVCNGKRLGPVRSSLSSGWGLGWQTYTS